MTVTNKVELIVVDERTLPLVQHQRYRALCTGGQGPVAGADHEARRVAHEHDRHGVTFALFDAADLVASAQVIPVSPMTPASAYDVYDLRNTLPRPDHGAVIVANLVTTPVRKGSNLLEPVMRAVLDFVAREKRRYIAVLADPALRDFYASMGFDTVREGLASGRASGEVALMIFDMRDTRHTNGESLAGWMFGPVFNG
ncbi:hypothetical protein [Henriciella aquimarina]|uniref:hypothetical protein n=1 Tax=Henriciella aquimarina TaxID=545261 RepID=UPI000A026FBD|nr:hypothetical protein [Henriciella aquimarina]